MVEPVEHLLGAKLRLARVETCLGKKLRNAGLGQSDKVGPAIRARRDVARNGNGIHLTGDRHEVSVWHDVAAYTGKRRRAPALLVEGSSHPSVAIGRTTKCLVVLLLPFVG